MKLKSFITNPWVIGSGTFVLGTLLLRIIDKIFSTSILLSIWKYIKTVFVWFFTANIKLWILVSIAVIIILFFLWVIKTIKKVILEPDLNTQIKPDYLNYNEDIFYSAKWKWKWSRWPKSKEYYPDKLCIICMKCGVQVNIAIDDMGEDNLCCVNSDCKEFEEWYTLNYNDRNIENIKKMIWARINSGKYKERVEEMK